MAVCGLVAAVGSGFTKPSIAGWYADLTKPPGNPPDWVFGPVWTLLYLSMAIAAWLVWQQRGIKTPAIAMFAVQWALNLAWSVLFFGMHSPCAALVDIAILWVAIARTLVMFWRIDWRAGALLVPYLAWVSFASYLNAAIWWLNR
jgi:tryptophan-rich sensory protein